MDYLSPAGALKLAKTLTDYWETRGLTVTYKIIKIKEDEDGKVLPSNMHALRTNLRFDKHGNAYTVEDF